MKQKRSWIARYRFLLIVLLAAAVVTSSAIAYFIRNTGEVTNDFSPAGSVNPEINETFDNNVKENVSIKVGKTGYPVYVRAAIVITWKDKDGIVYFSEPTKDTDYTITLNAPDWEQKDDGFYYYIDSTKSDNPLMAVQSDGSTKELIIECEPLNDAPADGYTLSVEIIAQTVQAVGTTDDDLKDAYEDAWVSLNN